MENNWSIEQTKNLFRYAYESHEKGKGLSWAFSKAAAESNRSVNSVRNYYYSQLKMFELVPSLAKDLGITLVASSRERFDLFSESEIRNLVEQILIGKANGDSVRSTISRLSNGDQKLALRLQNKYRSMITHHKTRVNAIMNGLGNSGTPYYNPYLKTVITDASAPDNQQRLADYIASLDEEAVDSFFTMLKKIFA